MLDESNNLNYCCFFCVVISDLCFSQKIVLLNPCFIFPKDLLLSLIDKVITET